MTFEEFNLRNELEESIIKKGYKNPSPIQEVAIPQILEGKNLVLQAQTGSGKTAAFAIPLLNAYREKDERFQSLILSPTRELAIQLAKEVKSLKGNIDVPIHVLYGGERIDQQIRSLKKRRGIIIATPGRLLDHLKRRTVRLDSIDYFICDEADEMLNMGFLEDVEDILEYSNPNAQKVLASATYSKKVQSFVKKFMNGPYESIKIAVSKDMLPNIDEKFFSVQNKDKIKLLRHLLTIHRNQKGIIFVNRKAETHEIYENISDLGLHVLMISGDLSQEERNKNMNHFRKVYPAIMIATDVAARGIDVDDVDLVINYGLPFESELYVHRIGRTARAGRTGTAVSLVNIREQSLLQRIEREQKRKIAKAELLSQEELDTLLLSGFENKLSYNDDKATLYFAQSMKNMYDNDALLNALLIDFYQKHRIESIENLNASSKNRGKKNYVRVRLNIGTKEKVAKMPLIHWFEDELNISRKDLGNVEVKRKESFVEVDKRYVDDVFRKVKRKKYRKFRVNAKRA